MKVHWTAAARAQLRDIHAYLTRTSPHYTQSTVDRLTRRSEQIGAFPFSGRVIPEAGDVHVREVLDGSHRVIYHVLEHQIDDIAVVHSARPWPPSS
jgi:toxin ParE1/3/4